MPAIATPYFWDNLGKSEAKVSQTGLSLVISRNRRRFVIAPRESRALLKNLTPVDVVQACDVRRELLPTHQGIRLLAQVISGVKFVDGINLGNNNQHLKAAA